MGFLRQCLQEARRCSGELDSWGGEPVQTIGGQDDPVQNELHENSVYPMSLTTPRWGSKPVQSNEHRRHGR
jgi:hypothetical protein